MSASCRCCGKTGHFRMKIDNEDIFVCDECWPNFKNAILKWEKGLARCERCGKIAEYYDGKHRFCKKCWHDWIEEAC